MTSRLIKVWENCQISDSSLNVTLLAIKSLEAGKLCEHNDNVFLSRMNQYSNLNILPVHILQNTHTENLCEKCPWLCMKSNKIFADIERLLIILPFSSHYPRHYILYYTCQKKCLMWIFNENDLWKINNSGHKNSFLNVFQEYLNIFDLEKLIWKAFRLVAFQIYFHKRIF